MRNLHLHEPDDTTPDDLPARAHELCMHTPQHSQQHVGAARPPALAPSPKKKSGRHAVTRQIFALPALQQFEPVLASSPRSSMVPTGSIPKISTAASKNSHSNDSRAGSSSARSATANSRGGEVEERPTSPVVATLASPPGSASGSPGLPHRPRSGRESSPRVLRPQPPPVGISSRADVDIYRYSQSTAQRMAIRPILEQRKAAEAHVARQILTHRESESASEETSRKAQQDGIQERHALEKVSTATEEITGDQKAYGIHELVNRAVEPPRSISAHRKRPGSGAYSEQPLRFESPESIDNTLSNQALEDNAFVETGSAHELIDDHQCDDRVSAALGMTENSTSVDAESLEDQTFPLASSGTDGALLVQPLLPGRCYEPFLAVDQKRLSIVPPKLVAFGVSPRRPQNVAERAQSGQVLFRVLWKNLRVFHGSCEMMLSVLLSSEAEAHIAIANPSRDRGTATTTTANSPPNKAASIQITNAYIAMSRKLRPDLPVLTPMWAKWMLSRIQCDAKGDYYLQLDSDDALENSRCFTDDSVVIDGRQLRVDMNVICETNLLVSISDTKSGEKSTVFLSSSEIAQLAKSLGAAPKNEVADVDDTAMDELIKDPAFLSQIVTNSSAVRLGAMARNLNTSLGSPERDTSIEKCSTSVSDIGNGADVNPVPSAFLPDVFSLVLENSTLATVALLSQVYVEDGMISALRHFQRAEAVKLHIDSYMAHQIATSVEPKFVELVSSKVEAAKHAKFTEIAICSIVEDMVTELIAYESRVELYEAKNSGRYDDLYASKVQSMYRMSTQRKKYTQKQHTRMQAARLLQALQRGIMARKRYSQMKIEREKYLFYGFRSSLHASSAGMEDPKKRALEMAEEAERKRYTFLMQVLEGYVNENGIPVPYRLAAEQIETVFNEFGLVVGCPASFGETVTSFLETDEDGTVSPRMKANSTPREPLQLYTRGQISAALLLGLRSQYDDTFGLSSTTRRLVAGDDRTDSVDDVPPRWLLKISPPFQRANRNRLTVLRLARKTAGRKSSHLVARDFRNMLQSEAFSRFDSCRAMWEAGIRSRRAQRRVYDSSNKEDIVQQVLDDLIASIKDWGIDPEPLFAGLNLCLRHRHGKEITALVEAKFNAFADGVNKLHNKRSVLSLREEIEQELEELEKLLALRCLNIGQDHIVTVPPSEILHIVLNGSVDEEYVRHALTTVLPIANVAEKYVLARKMVLAYANAAYGDAINAICWSCLDVAENVTVEAAQFLDRITRIDEELGGSDREQLKTPSSTTQGRNSERGQSVPSAPPSSIASRALYLLTGAHAVTFLQFVTKVAHFNKTTQRRSLALLQPYAERFELHRLASAVAGLDNYDVTVRLYADAFAAPDIYANTRFWIQYEELFGVALAEAARATGESSRPEQHATPPS